MQSARPHRQHRESLLNSRRNRTTPTFRRRLSIESLEDRRLLSIGDLPIFEFHDDAYVLDGLSVVSKADVDCDGVVDLLVANVAHDSVRVLLGNGDGTFQPHREYLAGDGPSRVAFGYFDGDDVLDLATANWNEGTVSILLGNGDGTFQTQQDNPDAGAGAAAIAVGDFNGDGTTDLVTANQLAGTISFLSGHGDGSFESGEELVPLGTFLHTQYVLAANLNGDGIDDFIVANSGHNAISIWLGSSNGPVHLEGGDRLVGTDPLFMVLAHFNDDGILDLATANFYESTVSVLLGNENGTFQEELTPRLQTGTYPHSVDAADFNGDGIVDLVTANHFSASVSILLGNGDGTFQPHQEISVGYLPNSLAIGDFNGDDAPDVAVAYHEGSIVSVLLNQPPAILTGTKFEDLNNNGVRDAGEPGLEGWTINLERTAGELELVGKIRSPSDTWDAFGGPMKAVGEKILVGAYYRTEKAYLYDPPDELQVPDGIKPVTTFDNPLGSGGRFGAGISGFRDDDDVPDNDRVLVAAYLGPVDGLAAGIVYVFDYKNEDGAYKEYGALELSIPHPDPTSSADRFGMTLASWNDLIIVGSSGHTGDKGAVYRMALKPP